ncbi:ATP-binding protein [Natrialbaceae archaeon A-chndr2]
MDDTGFSEGDELTILSREELAERVRQRTADLENVMNTMVDVLLKIGPDGRILLANAAVSDVLGYEPASLEGQPIDYILASEGVDGAGPNGGGLVEQLLAHGRVTEFETVLETASGEPVRTSLSASVLQSDDGAIDGIVCVATDISQRTEAEERAAFLHSLLRHDLGNKLTVTDGYLELLGETSLTDQQREYLSYATGGVDEAIDLVRKVRTLNRVEAEEAVEPIDLERVLSESVNRHVDLAEKHDIAVTVDVAPNCRVRGGALLPELFSNLLENALVHSDGSQVRLGTDEDAGEGWVDVTVDDDGVGIDSAVKETILERGETAGEAAGTGLGTYLATRIADTYGGEIAVESSPLGGARFRVSLESAT